MVDICEIRDEYPDDSSTVVMEYFVNKNLDETHIDISEHHIWTNWGAMKMVIYRFSDGHDYDKMKKHQRKKTKV